MRYAALLTLGFLCFITESSPGEALHQPKALGKVHWERNYDQALNRAKTENKPLLLLFQEVPGCQGCVQFGQETLSHPLLVEAMEELFVPLAIFNNRGGHDAEILKRYKEPAWNFQVIRYLDHKGVDLIPRKDKVWTVEETAKRMVTALKAFGREAPRYLKSLSFRSDGPDSKTGAFAMYCFWEGEAKLGALPAVRRTEAGWIEGHEVVQVVYDGTKTTWPQLLRAARNLGCAQNAYPPAKEKPSNAAASSMSSFQESGYRRASASDQKHVLRASPLKNLALTAVQQTKINAALAKGDFTTALSWLSPRQRATHTSIMRNALLPNG